MLAIVLVNGHSMTPTLQNGERVLAWTPFSKWLFRRGSIVTLRHFHIRLTGEQRSQPHYRATVAAIECDPPEILIKRLVGLPGDTVCIPLSQLSPHMLATVDPQAVQHGDKLLWYVPDGHVFVRGDGRQSNDSVAWGPIPMTKLNQLILCRFPSFQRIS
jgi:signal peptidase I